MLRIKEFRKLNNLSQQELASHLGITQATLSGWENEKFEIDNKSLILCADLFGVSVDILLGRTDEQKNPESSQTPDHSDKNIVRIAARNGEFLERKMSDEQIDALRKIIEQMPEFTD